MEKSMKIALGSGIGAAACIAGAVYCKKRGQTGGMVACCVAGGCAAAGCVICALRGKGTLRPERGSARLPRITRLSDTQGNPPVRIGRRQAKPGEPMPIDKSDNMEFRTTKFFDFRLLRLPIFVEGIGVNSGSIFSLTCTLSEKSLDVFASGWFVGQNLVDKYQLFGEATLVVNGMQVDSKPFTAPDYDYVSKGYPYQTIGGTSFLHLFSSKDRIRLVLDFWLKIETDSGVNKGFWKYPVKELVIQ